MQKLCATTQRFSTPSGITAISSFICLFLYKKLKTSRLYLFWSGQVTFYIPACSNTINLYTTPHYGKIFSCIFYSILSFNAFAQVTKLPTYAIRTSYPIDNIKDTIAPKAGGTVKSEWDITRDSVVFHYNDKNLLELEQVFRTILNINGNSYPDTSRYYRKYLYDTKGRVLSIQHWTIIGSPDPNNPRHDGIFPYGDTYYHHTIQRIDSMAYDNHNKQTFYRRYETYDFYNSNLTMVVKDGWENDYQYDELGRLNKENSFFWKQNTKYPLSVNPADETTYWYTYQGSTNKILSRKCYIIASGYPTLVIATDSLFIYDTQDRIIRWETFPYYTPQNGINYSQTSYFDTTVYFNEKSYEYSAYLYGSSGTWNSRRSCGGGGIKYDTKNRLKFLYEGWINHVFDNISYNDYCINTGLNKTFFLPTTSRLHHYNDDNDANLLAIDSAYLYTEYTSGYTFTNNVYFDTIAYHSFEIIDTPTSVVDPIYSDNFSNMYPNPATSTVTILTNIPQGTLHIWGVDGQKWIQQEITDRSTIINISHLPAGLYIVELNGQRENW